MLNYTLKKILSLKPKAKIVFERYYLNYCCDENLTLAYVCRNAKIDPVVIIKEIDKIQQTPFKKKHINIHKLVSDTLINHHNHIKQNFIKITKLFESDIFNYEEFKHVKNTFFYLIEVLEHHIRKEEKVLFPYIIKLIQFENDKINFEYSPFGSIKSVISVMNSDHKTVCNAIKLLLEATKHFKIFSTGGVIFKEAYVSFRDLYLNLQRHMYLENYQLYPTCIELENSILNNYYKLNKNKENL